LEAAVNLLLEILSKIDDILWGLSLLFLLMGTGLFLTYRLRFLQFRKLFLALKYVFKPVNEEGAEGDVSSRSALFIALAATIGTGNIIGVTTAIKVGGPGAIFWMWIAGWVGMVTKYSGAMLSVKYRKRDAKGNMAGGPMYYLEYGVGSKLLAKMFAVFAIIASIAGIGVMPQINSITELFRVQFNVPILVSSIALCILVGYITLGGIKTISRIAGIVIPFVAAFYIIGASILILLNFTAVPEAIKLIVSSAFNPASMAGGASGTAIALAIQHGIRRGIFSSECGLGSAPIAAAAAKTNSPVRQGLIGMTGVFFDTIIINTLTGLLIIMSGRYGMNMIESEIINIAFTKGMLLGGLGEIVLVVSLIFFSFTTIIGWNYYGERCVTYLFGAKRIPYYKWLFIFMILVSGNVELDIVWMLSDVSNALMALPNILGLIILSPLIVRETNAYFESDHL